MGPLTGTKGLVFVCFRARMCAACVSSLECDLLQEPNGRYSTYRDLMAENIRVADNIATLCKCDLLQGPNGRDST